MGHDTIYVAIAGLIGVLVGKAIDFKRFSVASEQKSMQTELDTLKAEVKALKNELDDWKNKYYSLLERISVENIIVNKKETKENGTA